MLWFDLQGVEFHVLRTLTSWLGDVRAIFLEVSLAEVYKNVPRYDAVRGWLESAGFVVQFEQLPWKDAGNVLMVNRRFVNL